MARRGVNTVILIGNLGTDPESRFLPSGGAVTNISLATSESWKDKQTGALQERTEWHRVVFFNRLAEIAAEYLKKGSKVYIMGSLRTRKWQDNNGQDRYTTEIVANDMQMLDSRGAMGDAAGGFGGNYQPAPALGGPMPVTGPVTGGAPQAPAQQPAAMPKNPASQQAPEPAMAGGQFDDKFDDDIPF